MKIGLLMFDDVEVLDACGPFEVFSVANRVADSPFDIVTIGATAAPVVHARGGLPIGVSVPVTEAPDVDVVLVPGGVVDVVAQNPDVLAWIARARASAELVASICTGVFVLAAAGVLDHRPVTTHWEDIDALRAEWPQLDVVENVRYVDHGDLATSAGISAALDLSLHLVGRFCGPDVAAATARQMDYEVFWALQDPRAG